MVYVYKPKVFDLSTRIAVPTLIVDEDVEILAKKKVAKENSMDETQSTIDAEENK